MYLSVAEGMAWPHLIEDNQILLHVSSPAPSAYSLGVVQQSPCDLLE